MTTTAEAIRDGLIVFGHFTSVRFSITALIFNGGQGWNWTTDTRIFSTVLVGLLNQFQYLLISWQAA